MKRNIVILTLLISSYVNGQDTILIRQIDIIVAKIDSIATKGDLDSLKGGLLNEGGTTSDILFLKQGKVVQKISVINKAKNYSEKIIFHNGKPVFAQLSPPDKEKWTFYLIGEYAYFKYDNKITKGSGAYWYSMVDSYLNLFRDQIEK